jgi:cellulose synthase operon protein C
MKFAWSALWGASCDAPRVRAVPIVLAWLCAAVICLPAAAQAPAGTPPAKSSPAAIRQYRDAVTFHNQGLYDLAIGEWQAFLKNYPQDPLAAKARHYYGFCQLQLKKYDDAAAAFEAVLKADPKFELAEESYLCLGMAHMGAAQTGKPEEYDKAADAFRTMIEKFPKAKESGKALYSLGDSLYARGKKDEAIKAYTQALAQENLGPLRPDTLYALGVAQEESGKSAEAATTYDLYLKENKESPLRAEIILRRGELYFSAKDYANAGSWFASAAAAKDFALADLALNRQATSLYEQKKYAEAAALYASLPTRFPKSEFAAKAALNAGTCYYLSGNFDEAVKLLKQALAAGGDGTAEAAHWLARSLLKQKKFDDVLAVVTPVLASVGDGPLAADLMADQADAMYELEGKRKESVPLYAAIVKKFPQHSLAPKSLYMQSFILLQMGDYAAARAQADAFVKAYPKHELLNETKAVAAEADLLLGKYDASEKDYDELLAGSPGHDSADLWKMRRGLALYLQKKYAEVVKSLEPIAAKFKTPDEVAEAQFLVGSSQLELRQYDAAAKALAASLAAQPKWRQADETLLALAATERAQNKPAEALATVRKVLSDFPNSKMLDRAHYRLGEYAAAAGDNKLAETEYQSVVEKWPASLFAPHALNGLAWSQFSGKNYQAAADTMTKLMEKYPDTALVPRARSVRGMARQQLKQYDAAIEDVQAYLKSNPTGTAKSDALYVQGLCEAGLKKYGPAIEVFRTILKDDPSYPGADKVLYELGWALKAENKEPEAAEAFASLVKDHAASPLAAESLYLVGEFNYFQKKDYAKAAESYFAAEKKATGDLGEKAAYKLAYAYYQQQQYDKAQQGFDYQAGKYPQGELAADGLFMAAESLFKQEKYEAAAAAYQKSLARLPANKDLQVLAELHAAQSLAQLKKWDAALKVLVQAEKDFPDSSYMAEILCEHGTAQMNLGKSDDAFKLFEDATARSDGAVGARARFMMGEILFEKKDYKEAARNFFKVAHGFGDGPVPGPIQKWAANSSYEAARCFEVMKMKDQARKEYKEVMEKYPNSDKAPMAKSRIEALGS